MKRKRIVKADHDSEQLPRLGPEDEARQAAMTPAEIERAAIDDADNPPLTENELARAVSARRLRSLRARLGLSQTGLSQTAFARRYGIPVANLRQYEIGRVLPPRAVQAYLKVIEAEPERTAKALSSAA